MNGRYLEDFAIGQTFGSGCVRVTRTRSRPFAAKFDPQPFHLDEGTAQDSMFKGLATRDSSPVGSDLFAPLQPLRLTAPLWPFWADG